MKNTKANDDIGRHRSMRQLAANCSNCVWDKPAPNVKLASKVKQHNTYVHYTFTRTEAYTPWWTPVCQTNICCTCTLRAASIKRSWSGHLCMFLNWKTNWHVKRSDLALDTKHKRKVDAWQSRGKWPNKADYINSSNQPAKALATLQSFMVRATWNKMCVSAVAAGSSHRLHQR